MSLFRRSSFLLLAAYACVQLVVSLFVFDGSLRAPLRGSPASLCALTSFTHEGADNRVAAYDTFPLLDAALSSASPAAAFSTLPNGQAPNHGEPVWRHLSRLREATRDGWIHFVRSTDTTYKAWHQRMMRIDCRFFRVLNSRVFD
jgi:hypothetical protein